MRIKIKRHKSLKSREILVQKVFEFKHQRKLIYLYFAQTYLFYLFPTYQMLDFAVELSFLSFTKDS